MVLLTLLHCTMVLLADSIALYNGSTDSIALYNGSTDSIALYNGSTDSTALYCAVPCFLTLLHSTALYCTIKWLFLYETYT